MMLTALALLAGLAQSGGTGVRVPPDWKIEVVAAAPAVRHPSVVSCAPDGRVFVAEDPMDISAPADRPLGRIRCFHPDGRVTLFADKLHAVFGMQYLEGKLYVLHNPKYTRFRDDDGVGRDREDLIEHTNPKPWAGDWNDHVPANYKLAMDGFFYVAVGDKGVYGAVGRDGSRVELRGGGVIRMRPDATELEVVCRGVRNILDVAINEEDEVFTYDNTDEHHWMGRLTHMVEGGFYGYPWDFHPRRPWTLWMMADYGAGAATGTLAVEEDALPEEYRGTLFLADFGKRSVARVRIARDGATWRAVDRKEIFVNGSKEDNFRPVGICLSPDGKGVYICDWSHNDTKENVAVGRLLKATHTGAARATPRPEWWLAAAMGKGCSAPLDELLRSLSHPSMSVRLTAQRRLVERGEKAPIERLLGEVSASVRARRHAVWTLDLLGGSPAIAAAANDAEPSVRRQAVRALGTRRVRASAPLLRALLGDPDAGVRFQAATALGRLGEASAVPALLGALEEKDAFARYAVVTALHRIGAWAEIAKGLESDREAVQEGVVFALRDTYEESVVAALASAVRKGSPRIRAVSVDALAPLHRKDPPWKGEWWGSPYHPALSPRPPRTLAWAGTESVLAVLREALDDADARVRLAALAAIREANDPASAPKLRERFARETDGPVRGAILRALGFLRDAGARDLIAAVLADRSAEAALLEDAVVAAEQLGEADLLAKCVADRSPARESAIGALSRIGGETAVGALLAAAEDSNLEIRKAALTSLGALKSPKAVPALLAAFGRDETRFEAAEALSRISDARGVDAYLYGLESANPGLRSRSVKALESVAALSLPAVEARVSKLSPGAVAELQRIFASAPRTSAIFRARAVTADPKAHMEFALKNAGEVERGRALFSDLKGVSCIKCHRVGALGGDLGPDLSGVGAQFSRLDLAESVLYPGRKIREGYQQTMVRTKDGRVLAGLVKGETADELVLQDAEAQRHTIRKADIEQRKLSELSLMPDGLQTALSMQDFADLIAFLESLREKTPEAPGK